FLEKQLRSINLQQADKDYNIAEFYRRTGKAPSAYFCYEIVRRRYPGTKYADMATQKMQELRARLEKEQGKNASLPTPPSASGNGPPPAPVETAPQPRPFIPPPAPPQGGAPRQLPPGLTEGR